MLFERPARELCFDMPALNCDDLFPNPPRQIDEVSQDIPDIVTADIIDLNFTNGSLLQDKTDSSNDTQLPINKDNDGICHYDLPDIPKEAEKPEAVEIEKEANYYLTEEKDSNENSSPVTAEVQNNEEPCTDGAQTPSRLQLPLPVVSPALSISSYYSSAESVSSATSTSKKKKRKRHCVTCDLHFPHKADLLEHLKVHISQPSIQVQALPDDDSLLQEFRERQKTMETIDTEDEEQYTVVPEAKGDAPSQIESGSLKLKLKLSGSQNFQVVPMNRLTEKREPPPSRKPTERILTAQEIKSSPPLSSAPNVNGGPLDAMVALAEMQRTMKPQPTDDNLLENKYFECPTLDGLDQFAEEINNEAAEDLLKKLLEGGSQQMPQENDWSSNTNEFISIDRLANMCTVCNANFPDALRLHEHKRITGHNFQHPMHPPPLPPHISNMDMANPYRMRPPFQPHLAPSIPNAPRMQQGCGPPMNMRPTFQGYPPPQQQQRFLPAPPFGQVPPARRPPPLYRVPTPQNARPINMAPFAEMNPEMYIPSSNGNMMNGHFQPNQPHMERPPVFLKARLQRPIQRPKTPGMHERSPSATPSPPVGLSQQTVVRPKFLGPMSNQIPRPPLKKIKTEPGTDDCEIVSTQPRADGLPVIQSVQGGASVTQPFNNDNSKDPILLNDQITLSLKNKEQNKNPKEVANILANRGIIVTHKPKPHSAAPSRETSPKTVTQEAVQKLQLNNSVSIISKKRQHEAAMEDLQRQRTEEVPFISCPVADCGEQFLTQESLNRHTQRGHKLVKMGMKAFKCKLCPAMFSTQEGLVDHQRKNHRILKTSADELGIPIIDLRNDETKRKLAQLGIVNYIPLNPKSTNGCFGFPIVSVQGAGNPNICNMMGMGVNSLLSLGPIKQIPMRKMD
ncbi:uncharacterized protein LOC119657983 isoform X2 [Hermetia illucens]|uniref:uncharacterized protein LOC119657983 isoform X2 n=1 Tax=Hermetia illucens TaxID=343691 RepID=UPI0018CC0867|nr:uncharacterized protein LOC119657983 isoform X2 [Hermetia illucens]